jgi:hypothetical protein
VTRLAAVPARGRHRPGCPLPRRIENDPPSDNGFDHHEVPESAMTDIATNTPVEATTAAHGVLLTDAAAEKVKNLLQQEGATTCACASRCSPAGARA